LTSSVTARHIPIPRKMENFQSEIHKYSHIEFAPMDEKNITLLQKCCITKGRADTNGLERARGLCVCVSHLECGRQAVTQDSLHKEPDYTHVHPHTEGLQAARHGQMKWTQRWATALCLRCTWTFAPTPSNPSLCNALHCPHFFLGATVAMLGPDLLYGAIHCTRMSGVSH